MPNFSAPIHTGQACFPGLKSATFSIVAVDPSTGECGAAVASKFPAVGKIVPHVRGGVGAFCTQCYHRPEWGVAALDMLESGLLPEEVLGRLLRNDDGRGHRQLAIIDMAGRSASRNPDQAGPDGSWWGAMSGRFYSCQGNTLVGSEVITSMATAYETTKGNLAVRLMAALVAGDRAGGDHRGRLAAGIRVAGVGDPDGLFTLDVDNSDNAVQELRELFLERQGN